MVCIPLGRVFFYMQHFTLQLHGHHNMCKQIVKYENDFIFFTEVNSFLNMYTVISDVRRHSR